VLLEIIPREEWGAVHDDGFGDAPLPAEEMWLHHSAALMPDVEWVDRDRDGVDDSEAAAMRQLEAIGEDRFGRGISYTHGVVPAGRIYEGHGVGRQGAHTKGRNSRARAICWLGNFDVHKPTAAMIRATAWLLQEYVRRGWLLRPRLNGGHQQAPGAATACPGRYAMAAIPEINRLAAGPPITLEDDDVNLNDRLPAVKLSDGRTYTLTVGDVLHGLAQLIPGNGKASAPLTSHPHGQYVTRILAIPGLDAKLTAVQAAVVADRDLDPAELARLTAAALLPLVEDIAREVAGADNTDLVDQLLAELGSTLTGKRA
jgi:hypothetical protein